MSSPYIHIKLSIRRIILTRLKKEMVVQEISGKLTRMNKIKSWILKILLFFATSTASCIFSSMDNGNRLQRERGGREGEREREGGGREGERGREGEGEREREGEREGRE